MKYELMYIVSSTLTDENREVVINKISKFAEDKGAKIVSLDKMGMKKFAYPINFKNEGFYVLMNIEAQPTIVDEMTKMINITEDVVRFMFVKK